MNPSFSYRLRNGTVVKNQVPRKEATERCERDIPRLVPGLSDSNKIRAHAHSNEIGIDQSEVRNRPTTTRAQNHREYSPYISGTRKKLWITPTPLPVPVSPRLTILASKRTILALNLWEGIGRAK